MSLLRNQWLLIIVSNFLSIIKHLIIGGAVQDEWKMRKHHLSFFQKFQPETLENLVMVDPLIQEYWERARVRRTIVRDSQLTLQASKWPHIIRDLCQPCCSATGSVHQEPNYLDGKRTKSKAKKIHSILFHHVVCIPSFYSSGGKSSSAYSQVGVRVLGSL